MSIVTPSDFIGEVNIPDTDETAVASALQIFIDKYEPKFLKSLMGNDLYIEYVADPELEKWAPLIDELKPLIVNYVYFWYIRNNVNYNSGIGVVKAKAENAVAVSSTDRMTSVWNEMVSGVWEVAGKWDVSVYGAYYLNGFYGWYSFAYDWMGYKPDIFSKMNSLGL